MTLPITVIVPFAEFVMRGTDPPLPVAVPFPVITIAPEEVLEIALPVCAAELVIFSVPDPALVTPMDVVPFPPVTDPIMAAEVAPE